LQGKISVAAACRLVAFLQQILEIYIFVPFVTLQVFRSERDHELRPPSLRAVNLRRDIAWQQGWARGTAPRLNVGETGRERIDIPDVIVPDGDVIAGLKSPSTE
jgi:hypothetical protein